MRPGRRYLSAAGAACGGERWEASGPLWVAANAMARSAAIRMIAKPMVVRFGATTLVIGGSGGR